MATANCQRANAIRTSNSRPSASRLYLRVCNSANWVLKLSVMQIQRQHGLPRYRLPLNARAAAPEAVHEAAAWEDVAAAWNRAAARAALR